MLELFDPRGYLVAVLLDWKRFSFHSGGGSGLGTRRYHVLDLQPETAQWFELRTRSLASNDMKTLMKADALKAPLCLPGSLMVMALPTTKGRW